MDVRTRIAPAPTGFLHVGTARTAIFNWLFARQQKGVFIVRIEDTDKERSKKEFEGDILGGFQWLGLEWDELYRQSERVGIYQKFLESLLREGNAFWCPHTKEELGVEAEHQRAAKEPPRHRCSARNDKRREGELIRLNIPLGEKICFHDIVRGEICFETNLLSDVSLAKDLQTPLYNFAAVVDDHEMRISHIIRGEDHISNTPKQILIGRALGVGEPAWVHMALTLGKDRSKLSKRHGATALRDYREQGYLPEAMLNYLVLLGWNPGDEREVMEREELIEAFSLERLQKSAAIFDSEKLDWMNGKYIKKLFNENPDTLLEQSRKFFPDSDKLLMTNGQLFKILDIEKERIKKLSDLKENTAFFFKRPEYDADLLRWKGSQDIADVTKHLEAAKKNIAEDGPARPARLAEFSAKRAGGDVMAYADIHGRGEVLWPLRVALSGRAASPGPFEIMEVLGKEETIKRIDFALQKLVDKKNGKFFH